MEVSTKFGSAQGCAVRTGALKTGGQCKIKKWPGRHSFAYFALAVERKVKSPSRAKDQQRKLNQAPQAKAYE
jgi:hypothetical protein